MSLVVRYPTLGLNYVLDALKTHNLLNIILNNKP